MQPLISELASDPDFGELVAWFVDELPDRITGLRAVLEAENWPEVGRLAHQLKGAGGGYGYPAISAVARELEALAGDAPDPKAAAELVAKLTLLHERAKAGLGCTTTG